MASHVTHHRKSIRMLAYDYAQPGAYFVTLCTHNRESLFGDIVDDVMCLNTCGQIVQACWQAIPQHISFARLDVFVVMPNHFHAIVRIVEKVSCQGEASPICQGNIKSRSDASPLHRMPHGTTSGSLSAIVQNFKSVTARKINCIKQESATGVWQRSYYERVIRNEGELNAIRQYIENNPLKWALDRENPLASE